MAVIIIIFFSICQVRKGFIHRKLNQFLNHFFYSTKIYLIIDQKRSLNRDGRLKKGIPECFEQVFHFITIARRSQTHILFNREESYGADFKVAGSCDQRERTDTRDVLRQDQGQLDIK